MDIKNFTLSEKEEGVYRLYINDFVGGTINGTQVSEELRYIDNDPGTKRIDMEINSEGGSIIDGVRIASAMVDCETPIRTINKGYALSIAGVFYMLGDERHMVDFGLLMYHNPQRAGVDMNDIEDPKHKEVAIKMKSQLLSLMTMKCKSINKDELSEMMDKETWLNCDDAKIKGLVDVELKYSDKKAPKLKDMDKMPHMAFVNSIKDYYSSLEQHKSINNNFKENQMDVDLKNQYEARIKENESKVAEFENMVTDYKNQLADANAKIKEKDAENEQLKTENTANLQKIQTFEEQQAVDFVNSAIEEGKFKAENRAELIEKAKTDIESFKNLVEMIPTAKKIEGKQKPKISELIENADVLKELNQEDLGGLTRYEYLSKNNPAKLAEIKNKQPNIFKVLEEEYVNAHEAKMK